MLRSSGLASSMTSPPGSIFLRTSAISRWNEAVVSAMRRRFVTAVRARRMPDAVLSTDSKKAATASSCAGSRARPSTATEARTSSRSGGALNAISPSPRNRTVSAVAPSACATARGSLAGSSSARRAPPIGVCALATTAATIRSNSRARWAPGYMDESGVKSRVRAIANYSSCGPFGQGSGASCVDGQSGSGILTHRGLLACSLTFGPYRRVNPCDRMSGAPSPGRQFAADAVWNYAALVVTVAVGASTTFLIAGQMGTAALGVFGQLYAMYAIGAQIAVLGAHDSTQ